MSVTNKTNFSSVTGIHSAFCYMASSVSGQDESNPALGTTRRVPQEKFPRKPYNKSFIQPS